jgi:hypothetical protein
VALSSQHVPSCDNTATVHTTTAHRFVSRASHVEDELPEPLQGEACVIF